MTSYKNSGPIDAAASIDKDKIKGKTAIVTGGASGIGAAYCRALVDAGAFVIIADLNEDGGKKFQSELSKSSVFAKCDVTDWKSQLDVFKKAKSSSPSGRIDIVVANAGISGEDRVTLNDTSKDEPDEPTLPIFQVNAIGVMLTCKLALWYFKKQNESEPGKDQSLVLQSSLAGYVDLPWAPQYTSSKFAVRGLLRSLRQTEGANGVRVNLIAPWYIHTPIMGGDLPPLIESSGAGFAKVEDAAHGLLRIVSDSKAHGK